MGGEVGEGPGTGTVLPVTCDPKNYIADCGECGTIVCVKDGDNDYEECVVGPIPCGPCNSCTKITDINFECRFSASIPNGCDEDSVCQSKQCLQVGTKGECITNNKEGVCAPADNCMLNPVEVRCVNGGCPGVTQQDQCGTVGADWRYIKCTNPTSNVGYMSTSGDCVCTPSRECTFMLDPLDEV